MAALTTLSSNSRAACFRGGRVKMAMTRITRGRYGPHERPLTVVFVQDEPEMEPVRGIGSPEQEPDEFWSSPSEKKGANPFKDPMAWVGISSILLPFIILGIAIATGLVDTSVYGGR